jgi:hypothetical protein
MVANNSFTPPTQKFPHGAFSFYDSNLRKKIIGPTLRYPFGIASKRFHPLPNG